jgi:hypothetical protein
MSDNFKWTCNGCKQNFPSLTSMTAQLKSIEDTTINRLSIIEDKMNEMQHGMNDKIKEEVGEIKLKIVDEIRATLQDDVRREIREIEDQKIGQTVFCRNVFNFRRIVKYIFTLFFVVKNYLKRSVPFWYLVTQSK